MKSIGRAGLALAVVGVVVAYHQGLLPAALDAKIDAAATTVATTVAQTQAATAAESVAPDLSEYVVTVRGEDGQPGGWSTCTPISLVANLNGAPDGALADLQAAVDHLVQATGLQISLSVATSDIRPRADWGQVKENGFDGWAPVLLAWAPESSGLLPVAGASAIATPVWVNDADGHAQFVSGQIVFNSDHNDRYSHGFTPGVLSLGSLFEHELGHIVGLDHVDSPAELMYPEMGHAGQYAAGDLTGLEEVSSTGCRPEPVTTW